MPVHVVTHPTFPTAFSKMYKWKLKLKNKVQLTATVSDPAVILHLYVLLVFHWCWESMPHRTKGYLLFSRFLKQGLELIQGIET